MTANGEAYLVGNGEVYNHEDVVHDGDPLTDSDNEVGLHVLLEDGPAGLARLNGMFAFVMATEDGRFVAARDAVGIKPLYWTPHGPAVRFASEMQAFDRRLAAARRAVPAGMHVDAGGRPRALRLGRPRRSRAPSPTPTSSPEPARCSCAPSSVR